MPGSCSHDVSYRLKGACGRADSWAGPDCPLERLAESRERDRDLDRDLVRLAGEGDLEGDFERFDNERDFERERLDDERELDRLRGGPPASGFWGGIPLNDLNNFLSFSIPGGPKSVETSRSYVFLSISFANANPFGS